MKILSSLSELNPNVAIGLTIGNFDGVHAGHRQLLKNIKIDCLKNNLLFVVVTFIPHPQKIIQPDKEHFLISSYERKRTLLEEMEVDILVEINFTRDFSTLTPEDFLKQHLLSYPQLKNLYLGYDFAFGANKKGGHDLVHSLCAPLNISVEIQPIFEKNNQVVSSTLIRELLESGNIDEAKNFLERPFQLEGVVVKGEGRGKTIGFPTANIQVSQDLMVPQKGVYITRTNYNGMTYQSVTNIGSNPTFKNTYQLHVETYIFDFNNDIYGERLEIEFLQKLRNERKFPTVNDLISQISSDVKAAKLYLRDK